MYKSTLGESCPMQLCGNYIIITKLQCKMYYFIYVIAWIPMYRVLRLGVHITVTIRFALFGPTRGELF